MKQNNRTTIVLSILFVVLALYYFVDSIRKPGESEGAKKLFSGFVPSIDELDIDYPDRPDIHLELREDAGWYLTSPYDFKASDELVDGVIKDLIDISVDGIVSDKPSTHEQFGVSDSSAIHFQAFESGEKLIDVYIGKRTVDATHTYVRNAGSDEVMLWRYIFGHRIRMSTEDWRDKTLYDYNPDDILRIEAQGNGPSRTLINESGEWTFMVNGQQSDYSENKLAQFVGILSTLTANALADEEDIARIISSDPNVRVSFTVRNGDVNTYDLWVPGELESERYLLREKDGDMVYRFYAQIGPWLSMDPELLR